VRSRHEKVVAGLLCGAASEVFLPVHAALRQWSDRKQRVEMPLFPGYVFVRCAMSTQERVAILSASRSVVEVLGVKGRPVPVSDAEIESIRTVLRAGSEIDAEERLVEGTKVVVTNGPLKGVVGTVVTHRGRRRIVCAVQILGRSVFADFPKGDVDPLL